MVTSTILTILATIIPITIMFPPIIWTFAFFYSQKLNSYLEKNKPNRWKELSHGVSLYEIGSNTTRSLEIGFGIIKYYYNDLDFRNKTIRNYKIRIRFVINLFIMSMILVLAFIFVTVIIAWYSGNLSYSGGLS